MIVDDDHLFSGQLAAILQREGYIVQPVDNCLDALYHATSAAPDAFLISLDMSTTSGERLCAILRSQTRLAAAHRIVLTERADGADIDLEAIGAHAHVAKTPLQTLPNMLLSAMQRLGAQRAGAPNSEAQAAEEEKKALAEKLQHAQKMEVIGTLASGIAHDFNNILQTMLGYAQLSLFEPEIPPVVRRNLEEIQASAQKATSLIRRLLVFSRKVDSHLQPVNLNQQVHHVAKVLKRTIPRMVQIDMQLEDGLNLVRADGNLVELILINLGVNARDAMPDGGRLTFHTKNTRLDDTFCAEHPGAKPGEYAQLTVSDTGTGMSDHIRQQIFNPFFTTKESGKGTGLGLAMVYGIVKDHAGFITCDSSPDNGTTFDIFFPAVDASERGAASVARSEAAVPGDGETLLLVDDEKSIRDYGQQILSRYGYQVLVAQSGEEALEMYRCRKDDVDVAIIDLLMPGMGGIKCVKRLREIDPLCPIIIFSGFAGSEQIKAAMDAGAASFVAKPYLVKELLKKIRQVISRQCNDHSSSSGSIAN